MSVSTRRAPGPPRSRVRLRRLRAVHAVALPPRPDEHEPTKRDAFPSSTDAATLGERVGAAVKLAAVVVATGVASGFALWAFGSAAVRTVAGLVS